MLDLARLVDANTIDVDGVEYSAERVVVATGGKPIVPDIPGAELGITSDGFFELEDRPQRVLIAGSGYVSVELAGVLGGRDEASDVGAPVDRHTLAYDVGVPDDDPGVLALVLLVLEQFRECLADRGKKQLGEERPVVLPEHVQFVGRREDHVTVRRIQQSLFPAA